MSSRYDKRKIVVNDNELYRITLKEKGINYIRQYTTPILKSLKSEEMEGLEMIGYIWKVGDRYYKLSHKYYGSSKYWYIIAWFNQKPTESHVSLGDTIYIPVPLEKILQLLEI